MVIGVSWLIQAYGDRIFWKAFKSQNGEQQQFRRDAMMAAYAAMLSGYLHIIMKAGCLLLGGLSLVSPIDPDIQSSPQQLILPVIFILFLVLLDLDGYIRLKLRHKFFPPPEDED
jgi:hypothetical protein